MASEDSRNRDRCLRFIVSVIEAMTARPAFVQMRSVLHHLEHDSEPLEVVPLRGSEWMISEERDDDPDQFVAALHGEAQQR